MIKVVLTMPKFEADFGFKMKDTLSAMGMPTAFSNVANFSGMTGKPNLKIQEVIHKAYVKVSEKGTEAEAATAVIVGELTSVSPNPYKTMTIDRPFIFIIRDIQTNSILFVGRIMNPKI
jgi:serine protease inhibitor